MGEKEIIVRCHFIKVKKKQKQNKTFFHVAITPFFFLLSFLENQRNTKQHHFAQQTLLLYITPICEIGFLIVEIATLDIQICSI